MTGHSVRQPASRRTERGSAVHKLGALLIAAVIVTALGTSLGWFPDLSDAPTQQRLAEPPALVPGVTLRSPPAPRLVLAGASTAGQLSRPSLRLLLDRAIASKALGRHVEVAVGQLGARGRLVTRGGTGPVTPASLLKLLTLTAALEVLGPDHRFETSVVQGRRRSDVVLVGGGDPLLTAMRPTRSSRAIDPYPQPTSLVALARRTATQLVRAGVHRVRLQYDASLFSGPAINPAWRRSYIRADVVSPIRALWVDEGRARPGYAARVTDPALTAAQRFADLLRARGLRVAPVVAEVRVPADAAALARVQSAPLRAIVEHIVELSDNEGAEVLLRQVAIATGRSGSSRAGVRAVRETLAALGIDMSGVTVYDGSGLSRHDALPIRVLTDVLRSAASPARPDLHPILSSLPVAGFTGSLAYRFTTRDAQPAAGRRTSQDRHLDRGARPRWRHLHGWWPVAGVRRHRRRGAGTPNPGRTSPA